MKHVQALDGVRGLAILLVISFHSYLNGFGWIGVELFFVLSGFLITRGLLQDAALPWQQYLKRFYTRRILRIFPIYYLYLTLVGIMALALPHITWFHPTSRLFWVAVLTYTTNYACLFSLFTLFNHFWSLALEEQFYLVWPYIVKGTRRGLAAVALLLVVICPLLRAVAPSLLQRLGVPATKTAFAIYMLPIAHFDGFAVGTLLATFTRPCLRHPSRWLFGSLLVLLLVGATSHWFTQHTWTGYAYTLGFPGALPTACLWIYGYSLLFLTAGLLILTVQEPNRVTRAFSFTPLTYLGKISYGIYIYHILIRSFLLFLSPAIFNTAFGAILLLLLSVGVAAVSYRWIETPFLALKARVGTIPEAIPATTT